MSTEENETITSIARSLNTLHKIWPIIAVIGSIFTFIIGITITATTTWDTKVAKKEDIELLVKKINTLSTQVSDLSAKFSDYKKDNAADIVKIKSKSDSIIAVIHILKKEHKAHTGGYVIAIKKNGPGGVPTFIPYRP